MPSSGVSTLFEKLVLDLNTSSSLNIPPVLNPPEPESIKDLSDLLHSKKRFEKRFGELKYMLPFYTIGNEDDLQTVNKEILYLRERQKHGRLRNAIDATKSHGRLRNAIDATWRGISDNDVDSIIDLMQEKRNAAYENIYKKKIENNLLTQQSLGNIIDGRTIEGKDNFYLRDRFKNLQDALKVISRKYCSLNDLDDFKYTLGRIENNRYMKKKAGNDEEFRKLREGIIEKLGDYIDKNEKHYFRNVSSVSLKPDVKPKHIHYKSSLLKKAGYAAALAILAAGTLFVGKKSIERYQEPQFIVQYDKSPPAYRTPPELNSERIAFVDVNTDNIVNPEVEGLLPKMKGSFEYMRINFGLEDGDLAVAVFGDKQKACTYTVEQGKINVRSVYDVSTGKNGFGTGAWTSKTPPGVLRVCAKLGNGRPVGSVFGREGYLGTRVGISTDPDYNGDRYMTTRAIGVEPLEIVNLDAKIRGIFLHGTNKEGTIGKPDSKGCISFRNNEVIVFYDEVPDSTLLHSIPNSRNVYDASLKKRTGKNIVTEFIGEGNNELYHVIAIHESELNFLNAARDSCLEGTSITYLLGNNQRNLEIRTTNGTYEIDPNRAFSKSGIEMDFIKRYGIIEWGNLPSKTRDYIVSSALAVTQKISENALDGKPILALHENSPGELTIMSYLTDPEFMQFAEVGRVYVNPNMDPNNFAYVNTRPLFEAFRRKGINVVLQNNAPALDDGSLSYAAAMSGVPYVNVEVRKGTGKVQGRMIQAFNQIISENPNLLEQRPLMLLAQK